MQVRTRRRVGFGLVAFSVFASVWGITQPLPYVIVEPGPAYNVLGENEGVEVIQVTGVTVTENPGSLDLLTISVLGSPGNTPTFLELIQPFFSTDRSIVPVEFFYPVGLTAAESHAKDLKDFQESQAAAIAAAKTELPLAISSGLDVKLDLNGVVGPSGGLMFSLGIIDKATDGSLTGGKSIAGTGTISAAGEVGPIGGIDYKLISARRSGDQFFLAPTANCEQVVGHIPAGLRVFSVATLKEALRVLSVISADGDTSKLPVCSAK